MNTEKKHLPRLARSLEDFEIGQKIQWTTREYAGLLRPYREAGIVGERGFGLTIEYTGPCGPHGFDPIDLSRGVWVILEEAPPPPVDHVQQAKERLYGSLRRYDGARIGGDDRTETGLAALPDVVADSRNLIFRMNVAADPR